MTLCWCREGVCTPQGLEGVEGVARGLGEWAVYGDRAVTYARVLGELECWDARVGGILVPV
jgi:hypothetical protein